MYFTVEMAGMGFNSMSNSPASANAMQHLNQFMLQNLQQLIAANPNFLTAGIPNKLLSQMWVEPGKVMQSLNVSTFEFHRTFKSGLHLMTSWSFVVVIS